MRSLCVLSSSFSAANTQFRDPVYRFPSITVTASQSAELAKMAREEQLAMK